MRRYNSPGILIITNTLEKFKTADKEQLLKETSALVRLFACACTSYYVRQSDLEKYLFWSGHH